MYIAELVNDKCSIYHSEDITEVEDIIHHEIVTGNQVVFNSDSPEEVQSFCDKWNKELKYYTYEDINKLSNDEHLIVLQKTIGDDSIGLAHTDQLYEIKINDEYFYENYDFLVCTKILEGSNKYLIPIGCSDREQWIIQQEKNSQETQLNNILEEDNAILDICKELKYECGIKLCWNDIYQNVIEDYEDIENIKDEIKFNYMLQKVVQRCYTENFPIQEYRLFEIPYGDSNGWMIDFVNGQDYDDFHLRKIEDTKLRELDFWIEHTGNAIPQFFNPKTASQWNAADCISAVWYEQNSIRMPPQSETYYVYKLEDGKYAISINNKDLSLIKKTTRISKVEAILKILNA